MEKKKPRAEFIGDAYNSEEDVIARNLGDALDLFEDDEALQEVLGTKFCRAYSAVKRSEDKEFLQVISPWEREHLLMNV